MAVPVKNLKKTHTEPSLKAALLRIIKTKPLSKVTIKELCEEASVYRSTFYCHYASVEDLLTAIQNDVLRQIDTEYDALVSKRISTYAFVTELLEYVKSGKYDFAVLLGNSGKEADEYRVRMINHLTEKVSAIYSDIECPLAKTYLPMYITVGSLAIVSQWAANNCNESVEDIAQLILKLADSVKKA